MILYIIEKARNHTAVLYQNNKFKIYYRFNVIVLYKRKLSIFKIFVENPSASWNIKRILYIIHEFNIIWILYALYMIKKNTKVEALNLTPFP